MSQLVLESSEDQLELFIWRWKDISRADITERLKEFKKFDLNKTGELEENHTMMLLESRGETKTAVELRAMVAEIDKDHNHTVNFLEWCCAIYHKSWEDTNNFADDEARIRAMEEAKKAGEAARAVEQSMAEVRRREEEAAAAKAAELEAEAQLTGVRGKSAFFKRQAEGTADQTKTNEQKIKEEAALRRALKEAKAAEKAHLEEASKQKTAEEVAAELAEERRRTEEEAARVEAERVEKEKAERAARKAALNAKWSPPPKA